MKKSFILCILDGWGDAQASAVNALSQANTPTWDSLSDHFQKSLLSASGLDVGLPEGQMGNSEVGHMNIGAGRVMMQDLPRIDQAIKMGEFARNEELISFVRGLKNSDKPCHLMGLLSPGGVHSHISHILDLARLLDVQGIKTYVHGFLDGRDTPPHSAKEYVADFLREIESLSYVSLASLSGRYYAMDRDNRWERIDQAVDVLQYAKGAQFNDPCAYIQESYDQEISDEFVIPAFVQGYPGIQYGDGLLMANFRADRVRQILSRFVNASELKGSPFLGMVSYSRELDARMKALFPPQDLTHTLGQVVSEQHLKQLRLAETEKYAHVTYFLNGGREEPFEGEDRILVPSPKVATYDLQPEMSAREVTDELCKAIKAEEYDLIVVNYANPDMVGHTGDLDASIKAVETVDQCLARLWKTVQDQDGVLLITSDHGNVEMMKDEVTGKIHTAHTLNPVPFLVCSREAVSLKPDGILADIAPTILQLMGIEQPVEMTGHSLLIT